MRLVTWNIAGLDDHALHERTEAAVFVAVMGARLDQVSPDRSDAPDPPDVIVFQEVVARTFKAHVLPHLRAGGYRVVPQVPPDRQTFEVIALRSTVAPRAYHAEPLRDSVYGRVLHVVDADVADGPIRILTGHLDSGSDADAVRVREAQLRQIAEQLGGHGVFAGDANLRKAEWLALRDSLAMTDAWEALGEPGDTRVTWRRNIDEPGGRDSTFQARFDRVFLGPGLVVRSMRALGVEPLPGLGVPISDHVGLAVELVRS